MKLSSLKWTLIILSILILIVGCIIVGNPFHSDVVITYMFIIALGVHGIVSICEFAVAEEKSAFDLVIGILEIVVCLMLLSNGVLIAQATIGYVLAAILLVRGIGDFVMAYNLKKHTELPIGGHIATGILTILVAICFICAPIFSKVLYTFIIGIFLVISAIVMFINAVTISVPKEAK